MPGPIIQVGEGVQCQVQALVHCPPSKTVSLPWEAIHLRSHLAMHRVRAHRPRLVVERERSGNLGRATAETHRAKMGLRSGRHEDEVHKSSLALDGHRLDSEQTRIWLVKTRSRSRCCRNQVFPSAMASKLLFFKRLPKLLKPFSSSSYSIRRCRFLLLEASRPRTLSETTQWVPASRTFCSNLSQDSQGPAAIDYSSVLQEDEFHSLANSTIHHFLEKLEEYGDNVEIDGFDVDYGNEVLTLKLGDLEQTSDVLVIRSDIVVHPGLIGIRMLKLGFIGGQKHIC
uniref:Uncharacterized protein n=1 Tax=Fagus sylvatica TaxID=28930 RepID=A0A2N9F3V0_FAGSY